MKIFDSAQLVTLRGPARQGSPLSTHDPRTAVVDQIDEVIRCQPIIDRHQHGRSEVSRNTPPGARVEIGCDVGDSVTLSDPHTLKCRGPKIAAVEEFGYVKRRSPSTTASRSAYSRRARRANSSGGESDFHVVLQPGAQ